MRKSNSNNNKDLEYKVYLEERKLLVDTEREEARLFDKAILTLAAGAFGLSLTFIRQIVPNIKYETLWILIVAWAGFCVSLLSTLISFLTSQSAFRRQREILEVEWLDNSSKKNEKDNLENTPAIWTKRLNIISIVAFIIGAVFLTTFSIINLKEDVMSKKKSGFVKTEGVVPPKSPRKVEKGVVPPSSPRKPPIKPPKRGN